jgi:DNA polymerase-3 subunit delta
MAGLAPVYLLLGPEEGQKNEFITAAIDSYRKKAGEEPEIYRYYPYETDIGEVISVIRNGSLFSSYKFVILRNIEDLKAPDLKELSSYLASPEKSATLFLATSAYRPQKTVQNHIVKRVPKDQQKTFFELFENKKREWLINYFRSAGITVDTEAVALLLELVENNTLEMKSAADRLIFYFGSGADLDADAVEEFIYHSKEENVFSLFAKIVTRDFSSSLETLRTIVHSGGSNPVQLIAGLVWQFRRLLKLSRLLDLRYDPQEACRNVPLYGKRNQNTYLQGRKHFDTEELQRILSLLARYDAALREQSGDVQEILLDMCLYHILHTPARRNSYQQSSFLS